jgi:hypothetical protein
LPEPDEKQPDENQSDDDNFRKKSLFETHVVRVDAVTDKTGDSQSAESRFHELVEPGTEKDEAGQQIVTTYVIYIYIRLLKYISDWCTVRILQSIRGERYTLDSDPTGVTSPFRNA